MFIASICSKILKMSSLKAIAKALRVLADEERTLAERAKIR